MTGDRALRRLFVANRGEIARRIATTANARGIEALLPSLEGPGAVDLLDAGAIVAAARSLRADSLHPGYGFLAESADLAAAVIEAGMAWVGPPPEAIRAVGDKAVARGIARGLDVPVAAGEEPDDQSDGSLVRAAGRIGYPVLVKPAAGGGGKGIRVVGAADDLPAALAAARREAGRAFADERLLLERFVEDARHVEVQILGDAHGSVVHLGDRDCSLQRRHQKLLEEAPAPGLDPATRVALRTSAVRLAAAVGYVSAGTCEFLVGGDGRHVFLEMNARLQVEHPVTELVLGRDLVADQLAIASGATLADLGLTQDVIDERLASGGHAVEVRVNAEDPSAGFLPSTGRVVALRWAPGALSFGQVGDAGVRVDAGVDEGSVVDARFDPLLAKVIAHGPDRAAALDRLAEALDATEILGLPTNLAFLRRLVRLPVVREGRTRTHTIERDPDALAAAARAVVVPDHAWAVAARLLAAGAGDPWGGGWRLNAPRRVRLTTDAGDAGPRAVELPTGGSGPVPAAAMTPPFAVRDGEVAHLSVDGLDAAFRLEPPPSIEDAVGRATNAAGGSGAAVGVPAPMPGVVLAVHVWRGSHVAAGDRMATLEAMKMEHVVVAPRDGEVEEVTVREGDQVQRGTLVARLASRP